MNVVFTDMVDGIIAGIIKQTCFELATAAATMDERKAEVALREGTRKIRKLVDEQTDKAMMRREVEGSQP